VSEASRQEGALHVALHVAYHVQQFPPEVGAGPARVTEMARRWRAAGAEVTVLTGVPTQRIPDAAAGDARRYRGRPFVREQRDGVRVLRSWQYRQRRGGFLGTIVNNASLMVTGALHGLLRLRRANVLIASTPPLSLHLSGVAIALGRGIPLVLEIRDLWVDYLVGMGVLREGQLVTRLLFALERWLLARADAVVVISESFRLRAIAKGVPASRVAVVPNGVDVERYRPADEPPPIGALVHREGEFLVGYMGTLGAGQGLEAVIRAAELLAARDPAVRLVIVGDGPRRDALAAAIAGAGLTNISMHGAITREGTLGFYTACDACLVPLAAIPVFQETIPSKIFEVMACARPVVACLDGEGRRIVEESGGGVVAPPEDAEGIAAAVMRLHAMDAEARARMGRAGREYVIAHYRREALADRYLELLARVARRESPVAA
jgi:glycosyltransferase involved in cell wall biosynthesis